MRSCSKASDDAAGFSSCPGMLAIAWATSTWRLPPISNTGFSSLIGLDVEHVAFALAGHRMHVQPGH